MSNLLFLIDILSPLPNTVYIWHENKSLRFRILFWTRTWTTGHDIVWFYSGLVHYVHWTQLTNWNRNTFYFDIFWLVKGRLWNFAELMFWIQNRYDMEHILCYIICMALIDIRYKISSFSAILEKSITLVKTNLPKNLSL